MPVTIILLPILIQQVVKFPQNHNLRIYEIIWTPKHKIAEVLELTVQYGSQMWLLRT